jgi:CheY-like chemotaxis protein
MSPHKAQGRTPNDVERPADKARVRLLVVDDEPALREIATSVLTQEGYDVLTAEDGFDALRLLSEPLPDVMITDLNMPGMSGVTLLEVVRQRFPQLPVIVISGQCIAHEPPAGVLADAFLSKGAYTHLELCAKIAELVSVSHARRGSTGDSQPAVSES